MNPSGKNREWPRGRGALLFVACIAVLAWLPGLGGGFVFDDLSNIASHPSFARPIDSLTAFWEALMAASSSSIGRPLALLTLVGNFMLTGLDPYWFKLTNLLIHLANGLLLWRLLQRILEQPAVASALAAGRLSPRSASVWFALAWTVLAVQVSAVYLVVQRMEMLAHTFVVCALLCYVAGRQRMIDGRAGGAWLVALGLVVLPAVGILAKETAILAPAYAFLLEIYLFRFATSGRANWSRRLAIAYALLLAAALWIFIQWLWPVALDPRAWAGRDFDMRERLWSELRVLWLYLRWILIPDLGSMSLYHDAYPVSRGWLMPVTTLLSAVGWLGVLAMLAWRARGPSLLGLGVSIYLAAHLLTASVFPLELVFEHRNYTASTGVLLALLPMLLRLRRIGDRQRSLAVALFAVFLGSQILVTALRTLEWSNPLHHALAEATRNPRSPRAVYELGRVQYMYSDGDPSHPGFGMAQESFRRAAALPGASALPVQGLIFAASHDGRGNDPALWDELDAHLRGARLDVQTIGALTALITCHGNGKCSLPLDRLVRSLAIAANREPPSAELLVAYGTLAITHMKDPALAGELFRAAVAAEPNNPLRRHSYGQYLAMTGQFDEAEAAAAEMERLDRWRRYGSRSQALRKLIAELRDARSRQ